MMPPPVDYQRAPGTRVALGHAALRWAKPRRSVTAAASHTRAHHVHAHTLHRAHPLRGSDVQAPWCRLGVRRHLSDRAAAAAPRSDAAPSPPACARDLAALLSPCGRCRARRAGGGAPARAWPSPRGPVAPGVLARWSRRLAGDARHALAWPAPGGRTARAWADGPGRRLGESCHGAGGARSPRPRPCSGEAPPRRRARRVPPLAAVTGPCASGTATRCPRCAAASHTVRAARPTPARAGRGPVLGGGRPSRPRANGWWRPRLALVLWPWRTAWGRRGRPGGRRTVSRSGCRTASERP
jgi:hypothetical protein